MGEQADNEAGQSAHCTGPDCPEERAPERQRYSV